MSTADPHQEPESARAPSHARFLESEIEQPAPETARVHVIPVPYERTVSYGGGTAAGPGAIIEASNQLEVFDGYGVPAEAGIYTHPPIDCSGEREAVYERIRAACAAAVRVGALPVVLGGEHSISLPAIEGVNRAVARTSGAPGASAQAGGEAAGEIGGGAIGVVQFDAHADLRDRYEDDPFSHATVMKRLLDSGYRALQLGVRALSPEEAALREQLVAEGLLVYHDAVELVPRRTSELRVPEQLPEQVYVTIDLDALDPSIIPATGTPEPGGFEWYQILALIDSVARRRRIVGLDVVELAPTAGLHMADFAAARLTYQAIGSVLRHAGELRFKSGPGRKIGGR